MILIVGGTGSLGSATARRLLAKDKPVRIMTRTQEKAVALEKLGAEIVQGDLLDKASLERACSGVEKVMTAAHSAIGRGKEASKHVDLQGHIDLIDAAKKAGVKQFVYTSIYDFGKLYESVPLMRYKRQVERYLKASGLNFTILRPTFLMESFAEFLIGNEILEKGKVTLFGKGENPHNFVAADDVAQVAVLALENPALTGMTINTGGLDNISSMEVVRLYEGIAGNPAKVSHVPLWMLRLMYPLLRPLHPGMSQLMQSSVYADTVDCTFDPAELLATYPVKLTPLSDWLAQRDYQTSRLAGHTVQA